MSPLASAIGVGSDGRAGAMPRNDEREPCGGERVLDLALCLIVAVSVVGLLLLAF